MTKIEEKVKEQYESIYNFAIQMKWSQPRTYYVCKRNPSDMQGKKLSKIAKILNCEIKDLL